MRTDILEHEFEIKEWISERLPKAEICRKLHCKESTLNSYLKKMNIDYKGNQGTKGLYNNKNKKYVPVTLYLNNSKRIKSHELKLKLIKDKIKEYKCERCGRDKWEGEPIPLELHHINGDHYDNHLENLQILCPNCHSLTYNHAGKALRIMNKEVTIKKVINKKVTIRKSDKNKKLLTAEEYAAAKRKAGETMYKNKTRRRVNRPETYELFKKEMDELNWNYCAMGRKYNVSDNAIRKWEKQYMKHEVL